MKYTETGEYTLIYTAVDSCGNETVEERTIHVVTPATVLFTDGTLIINEMLQDRESNIAEHGAVIQEFDPLNAQNTYVFNGTSERPWNSKQSEIKAVKFGSVVAPTSLAYWFQNCTNLESIDWTNFDGSNVTTARAFVANTKLASLILPEMPNLTNIRYICNACPNLVSVDMSGVNATGITDINASFQACYALETIDLSGLAGTIDACSNAFSNVSGGANMALTTIYANARLDFSQATASNNVFRACVDLVGGQGTTYDAGYIGKQYARIDNPPNEPGYFTAK